jgi:LuxR family maltose regulon positive regulatory protein
MIELLATKLFIPRPRKNMVSRPRLVKRLNAGLDKKLILVAAPAGFGKTTLLARLLIARGDLETAERLLHRLNESAAAYGRYGSPQITNLEGQHDINTSSRLFPLTEPKRSPYDFTVVWKWMK